MSYQDHPLTTPQAGIISGNCVRLIADPVHLPLSGDTSVPESNVELIREDGLVRAIRVTCGCGETILLECDYEHRK